MYVSKSISKMFAKMDKTIREVHELAAAAREVMAEMEVEKALAKLDEGSGSPEKYDETWNMDDSTVVSELDDSIAAVFDSAYLPVACSTPIPEEIVEQKEDNVEAEEKKDEDASEDGEELFKLVFDDSIEQTNNECESDNEYEQDF
ncbi:unnamed protein product [Caenorhabditis sp. 36 PRJEB53466]|nr:unnamed protein product [Caenorhabditis sp. 36 PRJEB53466]